MLAELLQDGDTDERCGFVMGDDSIVEVSNIAEDPSMRFHMDPKKVIEHIEKGAIATWHTHPSTDPNLSGDDHNCFMTWDELVHYIIGRRGGETVVVRYAVEDGMAVQS